MLLQSLWGKDCLGIKSKTDLLTSITTPMAYSITTQYWGSAIFGFDMD
jgi:hypothetical protein